MSDFGWRLSSDFRLSDYDQRLSRSEVSDFGWRLSDYDRPPSFRVEVRRFSDLLTGWRAISHRGGRTFYTLFPICLIGFYAPVVAAAGVLVQVVDLDRPEVIQLYVTLYKPSI